MISERVLAMPRERRLDKDVPFRDVPAWPIQHELTAASSRGEKEGGNLTVATATVNGITLGYETIGEGRPWVITPGGRFTKESPGVRELAVELAAHGNRVLIWTGRIAASRTCASRAPPSRPCRPTRWWRCSNTST